MEYFHAQIYYQQVRFITVFGKDVDIYTCDNLILNSLLRLVLTLTFLLPLVMQPLSPLQHGGIMKRSIWADTYIIEHLILYLSILLCFIKCALFA